MKIGIYTLTPQRDECIDGMLRRKFIRYGHEVYLRAYMTGARESICYEKPDIVMLPMVGGQYKLDTVEKCHEWGIHVVVRRGEAGQGREQFNLLDQDNKDVVLGYWDYAPYVDLELVWGQEFADILAEHDKMPADRIKACGAFAFDPYYAHGTNPYAVSTNSPKKDHKTTILFATGFSTAGCNPEYCETGLPKGCDYHGDKVKSHSSARKQWVEFINEFIRKFPDQYSYELKARPGETSSVYKDMLPDCVKLHPEGAASSKVLADVDILVHSGSTMAIEAHLLNIPSFNYCNVQPDPLLAKVSPVAEDYQTLEFMLRRAVIGQTNINEKVYDQLQAHLYGKVDGKACGTAYRHVKEYMDAAELRVKCIPDVWPREVKYMTPEVSIERVDDNHKWSCPCCRGIFYGIEFGCNQCPYCNMQIERRKVTEDGRVPEFKEQIILESVNK